MGAKAAWNHDAFFAYNDRWMKGGAALDPFVNAMWRAYRAQVPEGAGGTQNRKWVWDEGGKSGAFVVFSEEAALGDHKERVWKNNAK